MANNFWQDIPKPIIALAPMEDVTDTVFREVVLSASSFEVLRVVYTEFCSTDGLCHPVGRKKVVHRLQVNPSERALLREKGIKLVAQIWGSNPENFRKAAAFISSEFEFDGIDINMGCPVKKIVKQGGCSALIGTPLLAKEIIQATKESTQLPVSVKTRTGVKAHNTQEWLGHVFECRPAAVILHCRTQSDMSDKPADWSQMNIAVSLRNTMVPEMPLIGNGDIFTLEQAQNFIQQTGADGAMFGRGIFHNPWLFNLAIVEKSPEEKLNLLWKHATLFDSTWGKAKNFAILRRFFKIYAHNFENAAKLKVELMNTMSLADVQRILEKAQLNNHVME